MPWGDRTGPLGYGPRTGRALGYCSGNSVPGYMVGGPGFGRGWGFGRGRGFGRGWGWHRGWGPGWQGYAPVVPYAYPDKETERKALETQIESLTRSIDALKNRLSELDKEE
ncbi:DUF5320 domain-containing protein [Hippea alviniae]|uniref:DUF5320 domain-containing protein n=1 Tax=Hippea alviniae TaxID=1279027 RepID=UPI0003B48BEF|nr:DUF5320 domain-containing protein [Hippea alviniae]